MKSLQGQLLVAAPKLRDPNFSRTVILLLQHGDEGAMGLVLNRTMGRSVREVWAELMKSECDSDEPFLIGGPVEGPLMALHGNAVVGGEAVCDGVYFSTDRDSLVSLAGYGDQTPFRLYSGYAGWGEGQLEMEMAEDDWLLVEGEPDLIFGDAEELWRRCVERFSRDQLFATFNLRHRPDEPGLN